MKYLIILLFIFPKNITAQITKKDKVICTTNDFSIYHNYSRKLSSDDFIIQFKRHYATFVFRKYTNYSNKKLDGCGSNMCSDKRIGTFNLEDYMTDLQMKDYFTKLIKYIEK